jgi:hypothetical protein
LASEAFGDKAGPGPSYRRSRPAPFETRPHQSGRGLQRRLLGRFSPLTLALALTGCHAEAPPPSRAPQAVRGLTAVVRHFPVESSNFVLVAEDSTQLVYAPDALPIPFRTVGLRVVVSGWVHPAHSPLEAIPITLTDIQRHDPGYTY